jgi:hypothetical protein
MAASLTFSPFFKGAREGIGQVLTGAATSQPHFGQLTKQIPRMIYRVLRLKSVS